MAISAWDKGQVFESALHIIDEMRHRNLVPNVVNYKASISVCAKEQVSEPALHLVEEMRHRDFVPNVINYSAAISSWH